MTAVVPEQDRRTMIPHAYLSELNKIAMYALTMGAPLGLVCHVTFLLNYLNAASPIPPMRSPRRSRP
jgi:hypothetical protein